MFNLYLYIAYIFSSFHFYKVFLYKAERTRTHTHVHTYTHTTSSRTPHTPYSACVLRGSALTHIHTHTKNSRERERERKQKGKTGSQVFLLRQPATPLCRPQRTKGKKK